MGDYSIVGSWDLCPRPRAMLYDKEARCFKFFVKMGPKRDVDNFQILPHGCWMECLTPEHFRNRDRGQAWEIRNTLEGEDSMIIEIRLLLSKTWAPESVEWSEYDRTALRPPSAFTVNCN